jgi:hypothetical protein
MISKILLNVAKIKYLKMTVTNRNGIHDEIKSRLHSGDAWFHSVHKLFFFLCPNLNVCLCSTVCKYACNVAFLAVFNRLTVLKYVPGVKSLSR